MKDTAQPPKGTQFLDLSSAIANETCHYLQDSDINTKELQELIGNKKLIKEIAEKNAHHFLQLVMLPKDGPTEYELVKSAKEFIADYESLTRFFKEIFDYDLNLTGIKIPKKENFTSYMAVPPDFTEAFISQKFVEKFKIKFESSFGSNISEHINFELEQRRPKRLYLFAHKGGDWADKEYLDKSNNDAEKDRILFTNVKEYLLITGFTKFTKGKFLHVSFKDDGWTHTSSIWKDWPDHQIPITGSSDYPNQIFMCNSGNKGKDAKSPTAGVRRVIYL